MAKKKKPYKADLFDLYLQWKSIPSIYRGMSGDTMEKIGVDEHLARNLLHIKTQAMFSLAYNIDPGTLSDWNKRIDDKQLLEPFRSKGLRKVVNNAIASLAVTQVRQPTPAGVKCLVEIAFGKERPMVDPPKVKSEEKEIVYKFGFPPEVQRSIRHTLDVAYGKKKETLEDKLKKLRD